MQPFCCGCMLLHEAPHLAALSDNVHHSVHPGESYRNCAFNLRLTSLQAVRERLQARRLLWNAVRRRACAAAAAGQGLCGLHQPSRWQTHPGPASLQLSAVMPNDALPPSSFEDLDGGQFPRPSSVGISLPSATCPGSGVAVSGSPEHST